MSWKTEWRTLFWPNDDSGGLSLTRDQVALRLFDNFESPATTATIAANWTGTNVTVTRETAAQLNGEGSMKVVVAGGAGSVYRSLNRATFGYPFPGHNGIRIRYVKFRATCDSGNETIRVTFGDVSDANHYRYWNITVGQSKYVEHVIDLDPDNTESYPAPTTGATAWDPEQIDRFGFTNLSTGRTFYIDDVEFVYEYSLPDLIGFPTEAPVDIGDVGSLHARINGLWANVKALEGQTYQYVKQGIAETEVGQSISWAIELLSDFAPPSTTEITPGNYTINRIRHGTTTEIVASTGASESAGTISASYTPAEDNWTEGDLIKTTFSGGYVETDEEPTELLTADANAGQAVITVDNAYQWQVGWRVRVYDDTPDTEYATISELTTPTTITLAGNLSNNYTTAANARVTRVIQTELTTAVFFTRVTREPTAEEYGRNWEISDFDLGDVADASADTERWSSEVVRGGAEASLADINTTVAGKIYVLADPDGTPVATGYGVRRIDTSVSRFFKYIVDDSITWGTTDANSGFSNLVVTKGSSFDANNYVRIGREKSNTVDRIAAEANFGGAGASTTTAAITDNAVAFKIERIADIWRTYYSTSQYPDYQWVLVAEFEDASSNMTEETSAILESYSPGDVDAQTVRSDFDNFYYQVNSGFLEQMYEEAQIVPIVTQQNDPRVDQNTAAGIEVVRIGLINTNNGLPVTGEIAPGTTLVDRFREGTDADWTNQAGETITNGEADGHITILYDFPNATWQPGDGARLRLQNATITDAVTGRVVTLPQLSFFFTVGGPPNADYTGNLWLGDVIGNKSDVANVTDAQATIIARLRAIEAALSVNAAGGGEFELDGVPDLWDALVNDSSSDASITTLTGDRDGAVLERLAAWVNSHGVTDAGTATGFEEDGTGGTLWESIVAVKGTFTTSSATVPADTGRTEANDYFNGDIIVPLSGAVVRQAKLIVDFANAGGVFTIDAENPFTAATGLVDYVILHFQQPLVPAADSSNNQTTAHVVGNKTDAIPAMDAAPANSSLVAHLKAILERVGATPADPDDSVLTNIGQRDDAATADDLSDIASTSIQAKLRRLHLRFSADAFSSTVQGVARTDVENMIQGLANYLSSGGAAWSVTADPGGAARDNLEQTLEDFAAILAGAGITTFPARAVAGDGVSLAEVIRHISESLGEDSANNVFDSSTVVANEDGSVLERLEDIDLEMESMVNNILADFDDFDVADADANTERWDVGYISGAEGGSADINTTTAGKLRVSVDPDVTPTAAGYGVHCAQPIVSKYFSATIDVDVSSFGTPAASWATLGMRVSPTTYDTNNVVYVQRQSSSDGVGNRLAAGAIFNGASQGELYFTSADNALAFKIDRLDNVWRCYYSLTQYPNYAWVLLGQYEDPSEYMDAQQSIYLDAYSPGNADTQTAVGDFDNYKLYVNLNGVSQQIAGDYDSSAVAEDGDGSVLERLEELRGRTSTGTYNREIADGTTEVTVANYTPTKNGVLAVELDVATLVTAGEGGTLIVRLKHTIDGSNLRTIDRADFLIGSDEVHPTVSGFVVEGANFVQITFQCNSAVGAQRAIPYRIIES